MLFKFRYVMVLLFCVMTGWMGWRLYEYFFDTTTPVVQFVGIENGGCYASDLTCHVSSSKTANMSVYLDGHPLIDTVRLSSKDLEYQFAVPARSLDNGTHSVRIDVTDATFNKNKATVERSFYVDTVPLQVSFLHPDADYRIFQGKTLHIQFHVNKEVKQACIHALANKYCCFPQAQNSSIYECFIPIACEETPNEYYFSLEVVDNVNNIVQLDNKFQIISFPFKKQSIQLDPEKVKQEKEVGLPMKSFENVIQELTSRSPQQKLWKGEFCPPIDILRVSCDFGTIRTTQEKGRYMHKAVDVFNMPKSVVWATQDGVVVLKERYEASGNTVVIDHGMGILSLFFHLEDFADIQVGQKIAKGNPIGRLGKTGYATGYHLHWEMRINNIAIDPIQWTEQAFFNV